MVGELDTPQTWRGHRCPRRPRPECSPPSFVGIIDTIWWRPTRGCALLSSMWKIAARHHLGRRAGPRHVIAALLPVTALALGLMWWPEYGDQSLFVVGAQQLREGSIYYRDFWDIK